MRVLKKACDLNVLAEFKKPLIVVCGGIAVDLGKLQTWKNQFQPAVN